MADLDELRVLLRAAQRRDRNRALAQVLLAAVVGGLLIAGCVLGLVLLARWSG